MSVFNGYETITDTVDSILAQQYKYLELIIVNDGSTDRTGEILQEFSKSDKRIKVFHQLNLGITQALMAGCDSAKGTYIARQDVGDKSTSSRLADQMAFLENNNDYNTVSSTTEYYSPEKLSLFTAAISENDLRSALTSSNVKNLSGPSHHGAVMFRKSDYVSVGGYRKEFYFAQDLDLWTRLIEIGQHGVLEQTHYIATLSPESLSGMNHKEQEKLKNIVCQMIATRSEGKDERKLLQEAEKVFPTGSSEDKTTKLAAANYFLGSVIMGQSPNTARKYFNHCLGLNHIHFKAMLKYLRTWL